MAHPPVPSKDPNLLPEPTRLEEWLVDHFEKGLTVPECAKLLAKGDRKKAQAIRKRLYRMVGRDKKFQQYVYERAHMNLAVGLNGATAAMSRRAARGRVDAAKLVMEASGFHTPRSKQEHSGEIKITVDIPRPDFVDAEAVDEGS